MVNDLSTPRLLLRPPTMEEVDEYARVWGDPNVTRHLPGGRPRSREQAERGLQSYIQHWEEHGFGAWSLYVTSDETWVGYCGLRHLPEMGEVELLYALDPWWWNRGLITEAARAAARHGFETVGLERIIALAVPQNVASIRVMEHLSMRFEKVVHAFGLEAVLYALSRGEFKSGCG